MPSCASTIITTAHMLCEQQPLTHHEPSQLLTCFVHNSHSPIICVQARSSQLPTCFEENSHSPMQSVGCTPSSCQVWCESNGFYCVQSTHTCAHSYTHQRTYTRTLIHTLNYTHTLSHTHTKLRTHAHILTYTHTRTNIDMHTDMHRQTQTHTRTHHPPPPIKSHLYARLSSTSVTAPPLVASSSKDPRSSCFTFELVPLESAQFRVSALADTATPHMQYVERDVLCACIQLQ